MYWYPVAQHEVDNSKADNREEVDCSELHVAEAQHPVDEAPDNARNERRRHHGVVFAGVGVGLGVAAGASVFFSVAGLAASLAAGLGGSFLPSVL